MDQSRKICQHCWKNALISVKFPDLEWSTVLKTSEDIQVHVALQVCAPTKKKTSVKCRVFLELYIHLLQTNLVPKPLGDEAFGLIEISKQKTVVIEVSI